MKGQKHSLWSWRFISFPLKYFVRGRQWDSKPNLVLPQNLASFCSSIRSDSANKVCGDGWWWIVHKVKNCIGEFNSFIQIDFARLCDFLRWVPALNSPWFSSQLVPTSLITWSGLLTKYPRLSPKAPTLSLFLVKLLHSCVSRKSSISLAECFNSPYGTQYFKEYAESVPNGASCEVLKNAAIKNKVGLSVLFTFICSCFHPEGLPHWWIHSWSLWRQLLQHEHCVVSSGATPGHS